VRTVVGSTITDFTFNAAGQRVSTWNGTTGAQIQGQYYWGSKPVAFYKNSATHFQHQDWLGTERLRTTYNGAVEGSFTSLPFGDAQTPSGSDLDQYHYAQLDYDSETTTSHAQFRQYNNTQGRWMASDPYSGSYDPFNPQSMNRYSYVLNNPLAFVDPFGLQGCSQVRPAGGVRAMFYNGCIGGGDCDMLGFNCPEGPDGGGPMDGNPSGPGNGNGPGGGGSAPSKGQTWKEFGQAAKSCAASSFGLSTAAAGGAVAAGTNALSTAGKFAGMTPGTSAASSFFRAVLPQAIESTWAPTLMNPLATSGVLGGVVGRWVPVVGEAILVVQGGNFVSCLWASDDNY